MAGTTDKLGRGALHAAALHGHGDCVDALVAAGADVNARDAHGVTPPMEAARAGANRVLARLLFRKPDPSATDAHGRTAPHLACASKQANLDTVKALLAIGIERAAAARDGRRAIDIAAAAGRWDLVASNRPGRRAPGLDRNHRNRSGARARRARAIAAGGVAWWPRACRRRLARAGAAAADRGAAARVSHRARARRRERSAIPAASRIRSTGAATRRQRGAATGRTPATAADRLHAAAARRRRFRCRCRRVAFRRCWPTRSTPQPGHAMPSTPSRSP